MNIPHCGLLNVTAAAVRRCPAQPDQLLQQVPDTPHGTAKTRQCGNSRTPQSRPQEALEAGTHRGSADLCPAVSLRGFPLPVSCAAQALLCSQFLPLHRQLLRNIQGPRSLCVRGLLKPSTTNPFSQLCSQKLRSGCAGLHSLWRLRPASSSFGFVSNPWPSLAGGCITLSLLHHHMLALLCVCVQISSLL